VIWLFLAISAVVVLAIALWTVMRVSSRLSYTEAVATYDLAAATGFVKQRLPNPTAERLSEEAVSLLLAWYLDYLRRSGVAAFGDADAFSRGKKASGSPGDADAALDNLLRRAAAEELSFEEVDVVVVLELNAEYLASIGAVGDQATPSAP